MSRHLPFWEHDKVWGSVLHCFVDDSVSVSYLEIKGGRYCSRHWHECRDNYFVVIEGLIIVEEWQDGDLVEGPPTSETRLTPGSTYCVKARSVHRFRSLRDSRVIEVYKGNGGEVDLDDINRFDVGGVCE